MPKNIETSTFAVMSSTVTYVSILLLGGEGNVSALIGVALYGALFAVLFYLTAIGGPKLVLSKLWLLAALFGLVVASELASIILGVHLAIPIEAKAWYIIRAPLSRSASFLELIKLSGLACAFFIGFLQSNTRSKAQQLIEFLLHAGLIYGLVSFFSFITSPLSTMFLIRKELFYDRLTGSFLSSNTAGTFFGICTVLQCGLFIHALRQNRLGFRGVNQKLLEKMILSCCSLLVFISCLLLTASRSAVVATFIGAAVIVIIDVISERPLSRREISWGLGLLIIISTSCIILSGSLLVHRVTLMGSESISRLYIYNLHSAKIFSGGLLGFGLGSFPSLNLDLFNESNYDYIWNIRSMHNVYLLWMEEKGIAALGMFLCILVIFFRIFESSIRRGEIYRRSILGATIVVFIHSLTDFALQDFGFAALWSLLLGAGYSEIRIDDKRGAFSASDGVV